jgi:hypothetical protein
LKETEQIIHKRPGREGLEVAERDEGTGGRRRQRRTMENEEEKDGGRLMQEAGELGRSVLGLVVPGQTGMDARYGRFGLGIISKGARGHRTLKFSPSSELYSVFPFSITGVIAAEGVLDVGHATTPGACWCGLVISATIHEQALQHTQWRNWLKRLYQPPGNSTS